MKKVLMYSILIIIIILGVFIYYKNNDNNNTVNNIATSTNLGSATSTAIVENDITKDWLVFKDLENKISFLYPKDLSTKYIHTVDWPPKISIENKKYSCTDNGNSENVLNGQTKSELINGKEYCITKESEGAAGTTYINYNYLFSFNEKSVNLIFSIKEVQCLNYDGENQAECLKERNEFNINNIVDKIFFSIKNTD